MRFDTLTGLAWLAHALTYSSGVNARAETVNEARTRILTEHAAKAKRVSFQAPGGLPFSFDCVPRLEQFDKRQNGQSPPSMSKSNGDSLSSRSAPDAITEGTGSIPPFFFRPPSASSASVSDAPFFFEPPGDPADSPPILLPPYLYTITSPDSNGAEAAITDTVPDTAAGLSSTSTSRSRQTFPFPSSAASCGQTIFVSDIEPYRAQSASTYTGTALPWFLTPHNGLLWLVDPQANWLVHNTPLSNTNSTYSYSATILNAKYVSGSETFSSPVFVPARTTVVEQACQIGARNCGYSIDLNAPQTANYIAAGSLAPTQTFSCGATTTITIGNRPFPTGQFLDNRTCIIAADLVFDYLSNQLPYDYVPGSNPSLEAVKLQTVTQGFYQSYAYCNATQTFYSTLISTRCPPNAGGGFNSPLLDPRALKTQVFDTPTVQLQQAAVQTPPPGNGGSAGGVLDGGQGAGGGQQGDYSNAAPASVPETAKQTSAPIADSPAAGNGNTDNSNAGQTGNSGAGAVSGNAGGSNTGQNGGSGAGTVPGSSGNSNFGQTSGNSAGANSGNTGSFNPGSTSNAGTGVVSGNTGGLSSGNTGTSGSGAVSEQSNAGASSGSGNTQANGIASTPNSGNAGTAQGQNAGSSGSNVQPATGNNANVGSSSGLNAAVGASADNAVANSGNNAVAGGQNQAAGQSIAGNVQSNAAAANGGVGSGTGSASSLNNIIPDGSVPIAPSLASAASSAASGASQALAAAGVAPPSGSQPTSFSDARSAASELRSASSRLAAAASTATGTALSSIRAAQTSLAAILSSVDAVVATASVSVARITTNAQGSRVTTTALVALTAVSLRTTVSTNSAGVATTIVEASVNDDTATTAISTSATRAAASSSSRAAAVNLRSGGQSHLTAALMSFFFSCLGMLV